MGTTAVRQTPPTPAGSQQPSAGDPGGAHVRVAIIGAGFTGLAMVHALRAAGITDWLILERADDVGGVWRQNTYPGIACDVPSHLYSFSFAPNPDWERTFSSGRQIWEYAQQVARDLRIDEQTRFGEEVLDAAWDEEQSVWRIRSTTLELTADVLIDGSGVLTDPTYPDIPGLDRFQGALFHSGDWNHEHDLTGERVAVIGTGASAIQIVPELQKRVRHLTVFQRTPGWVIPRNDRDVSEIERRVLRAVPPLQKLIRGWQYVYRDGVMLKNMHHRRFRRVMETISKAYMRATIDDPALREKLTPDFEIGCKRILITSVWYPALNQPNVDLETSRITEIRDHAVVTEDGTEHEVDAIVCATGFHVTDPPIAGPRPRPRRAVARRMVGRRAEGLPRRDDDELPEPLPHRQHRDRHRPHVADHADRVRDHVRHGRAAHDGGARARERRGHAGRAGPVRPQGPRDGQPDGVGHRRLRQLVPGSQRRALGRLALVRVALPQVDQALRRRGLPGDRARTGRRSGRVTPGAPASAVSH